MSINQKQDVSIYSKQNKIKAITMTYQQDLFKINKEMSDTYMQKYIGKNIYKVSNPPGGRSSIKIGWDQPTDNKNNNNHQSYNEALRTKNENMENDGFFMDKPGAWWGKGQRKSMNKNQQLGNYSFVERPNMAVSYNNSSNLQSSQLINIKPSYNISNPSTQFSNNSSYLSYSSKPYMPHIKTIQTTPTIIEPLNFNQPINSQSHLYQWQQSTRNLQQELKYYQQKNKLLMEKVYGGYSHQQVLNNKYQGDYYYPQSTKRNRISSLHDMTEQLQIALQQRYHHRINNNNSP